MPRSTKPKKDTGASFAQLEEDIANHFFDLQPGYAVFLGLHRYDGMLPDWSVPATQRWTKEADRLLKRLEGISTDELPEDRRVDRYLLRLLLESPLFDFRETHDLERNPMVYVSAFSLTPYMIREYAAIEPRIDAMIQILEGIPSFLDQGRRRLDAELPKPFVQLAISMGNGLRQHFAEAESFAIRRKEALGQRVQRARPAAQAAVEDFVHRLETEYLPRATDDFALGAKRYQRLLWVREGIETPFAQILAAGKADLKRNQDRLKELAKKSNQTVERLLDGLFKQHPTAAQLIPSAQGMVEETRKFISAKDLVTIPEPAVCRVEETPSYGRALTTASMNPPGPFDTTGDEGIYFVTPVDAQWSPEKQEEWLRSLNHVMLRNITIHEVFPGHYLQFLHFRRAAGSLARKVYLSSSFTEGWAHYTEQLAIERGFGNGGVEAEVAQLHDALLRNCRLIVSIGLHTGGLSLRQATQLFQKEAYFEELPAEREAIRGTFNPEYFCYTLGKLEILKVRQKYLAQKFGGSLKSFHDTLLGFGCPPIGLLDRLFAAS